MINDMEDLLIEILLWLPAKSLIRFKLVCKRWFSIISDHHFSHRHTLRHRHRSNPESSLLLRLEGTSNYFYLQGQNMVHYNFPPTFTEQTIWSFSNGLFLLVTSSILDDQLEYCHIYNPTTKQSRMISLNPNNKFPFVIGLNVAFDPFESPYYHIVCIRTTTISKPSCSRWSYCPLCQIQVYESKTSTWRLCGEPFSSPPDLDFNHGVYWKGGIHWRGACFDLVENCVWEHPELVGLPGMENLYGDYIESNGSLHYIAHFANEDSVVVFELESNYSQWLLKYRVNLDNVPLSVLSIIRGKSEEEDCRLVLHEPGKVMAYKIREKSVQELVDFKAKTFYKDCIQFVSRRTYQFIETLAPV